MASHRQRTLVVMRHAKADWPDVADHERPLADRGRRDAVVAGTNLVSLGLAPESVVCSTAARARETWKIVAKAFDRRPPTTYDDRLYEASAQALLYVVQETPDDIGTLLMVGHNPGAATLVAALAGSGDDGALALARERYPTSGTAVLTFDGAWADLNEKGAYLSSFTVPRA